MSHCLICGDEVDISRDMCQQCRTAASQADHLGNKKPLIERSAYGLRRQFAAVLARLEALADDFTEGSQERFTQAVHECTELRDQRWQVQQQLEKLGSGTHE